MSDYTVTTNFGAKDALTSGDGNKLIKGSELTVEFIAVAAAMATKLDKSTEASETVKGIVELATNAETITGTDTSRVVTPDDLTKRLATPPAIGGATPGTGAFTTLSATGVVTVGDDIRTNADSEDDIGTSSLRFKTLYVDEIVTDDHAVVMADAYGLITTPTSFDGTGVASVASSSTGFFEVEFDNAAGSTGKQVVVVTGHGTSALLLTVNYLTSSNVRIRQWVSGGAGVDVVINNFPIHLIRYIIP